MNTKTKSKSDKSLQVLERMSKKQLSLANFLWSIRECEEMSQTEFAKVLGVSRQYLCDLESGRKIASIKAAVEFAERLGYSEVQFIRFAIQDAIHKMGRKYTVQLGAA